MDGEIIHSHSIMFVNGIGISFFDDRIGCPKPDCIGFTKKKRDKMWIMSGLKASKVFLACNHEMYHLKHRNSEEDHRKIGLIVDALPDWVRHNECDALMKRLLSGRRNV